MNRLTVIHTGGLGDFLQVFPVLAAVRAAHPACRVTLLGRPAWMPLAHQTGLADACLDAETSGLHRLFAPSAAALPAALRGADAVLSFLPHAHLADNLRRLGSARLVEAVSFPAAGTCDRPAARFVYDQVSGPLGLPASDTVPRIPPACVAGLADDLPPLLRDAAPPVALAPGSGSREKNWPAARFLELAAQLNAAGLPTVWLLGPAELERFDAATLERMAPAARDEPILRVASLLARARCLVGNDSGPSHLAAALGRPAVALFGPSEARVWSPRGRHVRTIAAPTGRMADIAVAEVLEAALAACGSDAPGDRP